MVPERIVLREYFSNSGEESLIHSDAQYAKLEQSVEDFVMEPFRDLDCYQIGIGKLTKCFSSC